MGTKGSSYIHWIVQNKLSGKILLFGALSDLVSKLLRINND